MWGLKTVLCLVLASLPAAILPAEVLNVAEFPHEIPPDSHSLWGFHGKSVHVRGFWYPISTEEGVLTPSPNVKSCCLRAPAKISQHIVVRGKVPEIAFQTAITLEGVFRIEPLLNKEGDMIQLYVLDQAKEVQAKKTHAGIFILLSLLVIALIIVRLRRKRG